MIVSPGHLGQLPAMLLLLGCGASALAQSDAGTASPLEVPLKRESWTGDLDGMLERRVIRVLVPYSRTLFFNEHGHARGITADAVRAFENYLNDKHSAKLGSRPLTVILIPTARDQLLTQLTAGLGDIAAGNLTITPARKELADFVVPQAVRSMVKEVVVTGPASPELAQLEDLSGRVVHVRASSSYAESLTQLNTRLRAAGRAPVEVQSLPEELEDEDVMEMVQAGLLKLTVVDRWKARIWAKVLPDIRVREDLCLREEGEIGWAIRHGSPRLSAELDRFFVLTSRKWGGFDSRLATYQRRIQQITNNTRSAESRRFAAVVGLFEKYGRLYGLDPLMLTAQGFQESRLRQDARSVVGAIGVMQVMPATGAQMRVGDIQQLEPNVHAGTKYLSQLLTLYFPDASFDEVNRPLFAFASYNAGPGAISKLRREAMRRGLDGDRWFNQVEIVVAERIGLETTTYVRNIYKYYAAYKLGLLATEAGQAARKRATDTGGAADEEGSEKLSSPSPATSPPSR